MVDEKEYIEELLKTNLQGLSIQELSDKSNLSRQKVTLLLAELKGEEKIIVREIGQVKINYFKENKLPSNG